MGRHLTCMKVTGNVYKILAENPERKRPSCKWDKIEMNLRWWTRFIWLRMGSVTGSCKHRNEPLGSIKSRAHYELIKDSVPCNQSVSDLITFG